MEDSPGWCRASDAGQGFFVWSKKMKQRPGTKPKTTRDLPAGWRRKIIAMAKQGMTEQEIRREFGISNGLWYGLLRREPRFRQTIEAARSLRMSQRLGVAV